VFAYKRTETYHPETELTIAHDDPGLGIAWSVGEPTPSAKGRNGLRLAAIAGDRLPQYRPAPRSS
jgi:dTDP-4-dehydrorhamnose 3,5-epimerase-like enzyme